MPEEESPAYAQEFDIQEAEIALIGCIILNDGDEALLSCVDADLTEEAFSYFPVRATFAAALAMYYSGVRDVGGMKIAQYMSETKERLSRGREGQQSIMVSIGGMAVFSRLMDTKESLYHERYIPIVKKAWTLRQLTRVSGELRNNSIYPGDKTAEDIIGEGIQSLKSIESKGSNEAVPASKGVELVNERIRKAHEGGRGAMFGMSTGLKLLDMKTSGFQPGQLIGVAAAPKVGKTALAMRFTEAILFIEKMGVLWFSMEMDARECTERLVAQRGMIDFKRIADNIISSKHQDRYLKAMTDVKNAPFWVYDDSRLNILKIAARLRSHMNKHPNTKMVVVDYLGLINPVDRKEFRENVNAEITRELHEMAREHNVVVVILAQRNVSERKGSAQYNRPTGADIKYGSSMEADCNKLLMIWLKEDGNRSILIEYQRDGEIGPVEVDFMPWCAAFHNKGEGDQNYKDFEGVEEQESFI